ncbi:flavodoxin family protein [Xylanibacter oryzae]|uniref:flavodoxin family protein n=1 Tax=Xylanibacter oryzae TaxID=185293 RepID=UPI0004B17BEA|nr:flavodoxin family protein [Xylanibacter oryzae]
MKVLLVNGSPRKNGCTYTALSEVANTLNEEGIDTEIFYIGTKPIAGCLGCGKCGELKKCILDDKVNECLDKLASADGFIFGSPVYYASANGSLISLMDRLFTAGLRRGKESFYLKPAAAVTSARRAGTTSTIDEINKYFSLAQMPIVSSQYWNMVHGNTPEEVKQDIEGMQIMRTLGRNMAFMLKCKDVAIKAGIEMPKTEEPLKTNFIR